MKNRPSEHISPPGLKGKAAPSGRLWFHTLATLILLLLFGTTTALAQDYSGVYYIASNGYAQANTTTYYYLCPTENWYYYQSESPYYLQYTESPNNDNGMPFMTTYTCRDGNYDARKAVWIIEKQSNGYYHIKHAIDGKYLTRNVAMGNGSNVGRMRIHLEESPADPDDALFEIVWVESKSCYDIKTKNDDGSSGDNAKRRFLNVTDGNKNYLIANGKNDGPQINNKKISVGGIIGLYTKGSGDNETNGMWYLEKATVDPPIITNNYTANNTFTITAASGATIFYTTDGSTPTTSTQTTGTTTVNINQTDGMTVIKAIAKGTNDAFPSLVTTYEIPKCEKPVITVSEDMVTITSLIAGATIHYTTNGDPVTSSSPVYTAPFAKTEPLTVRAIAIKDGYLNSSEAKILPPTEVSSSSQITDMGGNYILAAGFTLSGSIGTDANPFTGTIDGEMVTRTFSYPLVAYAEDATIKNVILKDISISGGTNVGAVCNEARGASRIYNCGVLGTSTISGSGNVGSIVGLLDGTSRVINCYSFANVSGGTMAAGIVGNNNQASTQSNLKTIVVNCMFYGDITGGSSKYPVYGGNSINNDSDDGINPYCYYRKNATFTPTDYNRSWPAEEKNLTRFEYYRSVLNGNRKLCTWWVNGTVGTAPTDDDIKKAGIAKWVLDLSIAPYPILKPWDKYPSIINHDAVNRFNPGTKTWQSRSTANAWEGKSYSTLKVTVKAGSHNSSASDVTKYITITDMDTLNYDYGYYKIQLPYYNDVFGNPNGATHTAKYGNNYTDQVVTGWMITSVTTDGTVTEYNNFNANWETGYNFADRLCIDKDLYATSGRVFAQGGYYYIPQGVSDITITAKWGKAVYLANRGYSIDRVNVTNADYKSESAFALAGTIENTFHGQTVYDDLQNAIKALDVATVSNGVPSLSVYDQAIVLIGNHQVKNGGTKAADNKSIGYNLDSKWHPFTIMSADLDFDNEPDNCLEFQFRENTDRPGIQPIRFDFLPIIELGLAVRHNNLAYAIGVFVPQGHFEITETAFMRLTQFEWDCGQDPSKTRIANNVPVILNGGEFDQLSVRYDNGNRTGYFLLGGNLWFHRFAPGTHPNSLSSNKAKARLCAVNAIGGDFPEFYLSGLYRADITPRTDQGNPHCYIDGGKLGSVYGAGYEKINGSVTFKVNHALITEFYGGGINGSNPVGGNIDVTIDNSIVTKYCGGPRVGDMTGKTITTHATGTTFGIFYGGGNGGNSYYRQLQRDGDLASSHIATWTNENYNWDVFTPLGVIDDGTDNKGYHAEYEFEVFNQSNGVTDQITQRGFINWIQFGLTKTGDVSNTLTDCIINTNFYGGGNLGTVDGDVTSTLINTTVLGNAYGAGFSATIPTFQVHNKSTVQFPSITAGVITDGSIGYDSRVFEWTNDLNGMTEDERKADPTYQKDGKWYCYTWNSLENLGVVTGDVTLNIEGNTLVMGNVTENNLTVQSGGVFGGGDASGVDGSTHVEIDASGQKNGYAYNTYNVFGGGNKADVGGSVTVNMKQGIVDHDIYGGGALAHTNINNSSNTTDNVTEVNLTGGTVKGDVYGGGLGRLAGDNIQAVAASVEGDVTVTLDGTSMQSTSRIFGGNNINGTPLGQITVDIKNTANTGQDYDVAAVFGGGNMAAYTPTVATMPPIVIVEDNSNNSIRDLFGGGNAAAVPATSVTILGGRFDRVFAGGKGHEAVVNGNTVLHLLKGNVTHDVYGGGMEGSVAGSVTVNIGQSDGSTAVNIGNDVYGGGALANTNTANMSIVNGVESVNLQEGSKETVVNLYPGATIGHDVYGGGLGRKTVFDEDGITVLTPGIAALVYGNVTVTQFGAVLTAAYNTTLDVATSGRIFGCNNINGTPKGSVLVNIKKTARGENTGGYDLAAVYGGGNEAEYVPFNSSLQSCDLTTVIVSPDDCDDISIHSVYGGGNAASTPATNVIINGAHEIKYVFGGGNGAGQGNPGANVGYHDYSDSEFTGTSQEDINGRKESFAYGTGVASTNVYGGHIHFVYGGSNTLGNIREASVAMLDELSRCELHVDGIYGGGREAYMEGKTSVEMGCITGMTAIYGGSENADVGSDVHLNITSGHFDKVFGGNNKGGRIFGSITVNIEQTGCVPITIGELYLGGNNAPYSVFGYGDEVPNQNIGTDQNPELVTHYEPLEGDENHQQLYDDPILHIRSFQSIGTVFGGGNGKLARMVADPTVEINVTDGWVNGQYGGGKDEFDDYTGVPQMLDANGVIGTVFGGGNEAEVVGNTNVLIGDSLNVNATLNSMSELYKKIGDDGLKRGNILMTKSIQDGVKKVTYTIVDDENHQVEGTTPITVDVKPKVNGVTITGNVYGGGNQADVTNSATIQLGPNP